MQNEYIKVLLIEDNYDYSQIVKRKLHKSELVTFEVDWADCLSKGLKQLTHENIDLVLLDLNLPDSQEIDTFIKLQKHAPNTPIIIVTANEDEVMAIKSIQMGAQGYLIKNEIKTVNLARSILHSYLRFMMESNRHSKVSDPEGVDYFLNALHGNPNGLVIVNKNGYVQYINAAAELLFGRNEEEMHGSYFDFPLNTGKRTKVNISHKCGLNVVMEMQVVQIEWYSGTAYLVSFRDTDRSKKREGEL